MRSFIINSLKGNERVLKGLVTPMRTVPSNIEGPEYRITGKPHPQKAAIKIYDDREIPGLRKAARLARKILDYSLSLATPGITTEDIDILVHEKIIKQGAYPSPINYYGFPKAICTSVNEVVCHGIPDDRPLKAGDILSIDVSVYVGGYHGDNCGTIVVGDDKSDRRAQHLVTTTQTALNAAIEAIGPGICLTRVGNTIDRIAQNAGFQVVQEFCGHGTGEVLHMSPFVHHFANDFKLTLVPGMLFTIEPILVENKAAVFCWEDGWTIAARDGGRGAQFEHEVLITKDGVEVLTVPE